jgi:hypothetical protein
MEWERTYQEQQSLHTWQQDPCTSVRKSEQKARLLMPRLHNPHILLRLDRRSLDLFSLRLHQHVIQGNRNRRVKGDKLRCASDTNWRPGTGEGLEVGKALMGIGEVQDVGGESEEFESEGAGHVLMDDGEEEERANGRMRREMYEIPSGARSRTAADVGATGGTV